MAFKAIIMTILAISMAFALGFPVSSMAATQKSAKKSAVTKVKSANTKIKTTARIQKKTKKALSPISTSASATSIVASNALLNTSKNSVSTTSKDFSKDIERALAPQSAFSGSLGATRGTNLIDHQDGSRGDSMDYELNMVYKLSKNFGLSVKSGYSQDLKDSEANDFTDTSLSLSKSPIELGHYVMASPSTTIILATSKKSRIMQNLKSGIRVGTSFALNPTVNPNLSLAVSISGGQNFHDFDTDINGKVLNKYSFSQSLSLGYAFGDFSISTIFIHKNGWSYQNNMSEAFEHAQELGYKINERFSTALGHTNSGAALKANGEDSNFALINENSSIVYGTLTLAF